MIPIHDNYDLMKKPLGFVKIEKDDRVVVEFYEPVTIDTFHNVFGACSFRPIEKEKSSMREIDKSKETFKKAEIFGWSLCASAKIASETVKKTQEETVDKFKKDFLSGFTMEKKL